MSSGRRLPARSQSLSHLDFLFSRCPSFFSNTIIFFSKEPRLLMRQARVAQRQCCHFCFRGRVRLSSLWDPPVVPLPGGSDHPRSSPAAPYFKEIHFFFSIRLLHCPASTSVHSGRECEGVGDLGRGPVHASEHSNTPRTRQPLLSLPERDLLFLPTALLFITQVIIIAVCCFFF